MYSTWNLVLFPSSVKTAAMNTDGHKEPFGYIPGNGMSGSYGRSISRILRNFQTDFCSGCTMYISPTMCKDSLFSRSQHLLSFIVLMMAILIGVR